MKGMQELESAEEGSIVTLYDEVHGACDAVELFKKISEYGKKKDCILLESADVITKYGEKSIGSAEPCLKARGRGEHFEIIALNGTGKRFLGFMKGKLGFATGLKASVDRVAGKIPKKKEFVNESEKLRMVTHMDVLRSIGFALKPVQRLGGFHAGLMGAISYDFIDNFEKLPKNRRDVLREPDYEMNFYDNVFIVDYREKKTVFSASALIFGKGETEREKERCMAIIENYKKAFSSAPPRVRPARGVKTVVSADTTRKEFTSIVSRLKSHVLAGDVFQVVASRTVSTPYSAEPLDIYTALRELNPSPYMFYFSNSSGILLGSSPETFIKVEGTGRKTVEIRPIAGTKPRGYDESGIIDEDLDSRYEAELKNDKKELAEHTMLIDLARNDVARVCVPGTRVCERPYTVEKYSHVQHLVSSVSGTLKPGLDALHAYLASMNMGTLTGAPKVEAMKLLRLHEKTRRGFYGGSIGYLTPSGDFDSAIVIRSMSLQKGRAYIRAGAGIVYDSVPESEFAETERKARACLAAIETAEGKR